LNCCSNCFSDTALQGLIGDLSSQIGCCDFCETDQISIVSCENLSDTFGQLFELYANHTNAELSLRQPDPILLHNHLLQYWSKLFNLSLLKEKGVKQLVNQIARGSSLYVKELFEQPVEFGFLINAPKSLSEDFQLKWDSFSDEIKKTNRFFLSEKLDTDTLQSVFERLAIPYPTNTEFYRARISEKILPKIELGKPPVDKATPGRANPVGIPYLYVSDSEKTTFYETRISLHESITIGKFITHKPISLVSLKNITNFGPFEILDRGFELEEFIRFRPYLQKLENELSKPVRRQDVHLDYLPTQFLCEFIKSLGFDGVEYKSAMNPTGYNLAIFNDWKLECVDLNFYVVNELEYKWNKIV
jgi:hypothetical protein